MMQIYTLKRGRKSSDGLRVGAVTVTDCLGAALDAVEAKRRLARSL